MGPIDPAIAGAIEITRATTDSTTDRISLRIAHLQSGMARVSFELTEVSTQSSRETVVCLRGLPGYKSEGRGFAYSRSVRR